MSPEAHDPQIGDLEVRMKMPRLTGERNILIVDMQLERNGEITVFAIDDLPDGDTIVPYIGYILEQTTGQDVLSGRPLHTASGEEVWGAVCLKTSLTSMFNTGIDV